MSQHYHPRQHTHPRDDHHLVDHTTDLCSRICGLVVLGFAISGAVMSCLALLSCEFLVATLIVDSNGDDEFTVGGIRGDDLVPSQALNVYSVGLFLYQDPSLDDEVCYYYDFSSPSVIPVHIRFARMGIFLATFFSTLAALMLVLEFCFCRFWCSRVLIIFCFFMALLSIPLTFAVFADAKCRPISQSVIRDTDEPASTFFSGCEIGQGGNMAIAATGAFFITLILLCLAPKPVPIIRALATSDSRKSIEQCRCCCPDIRLRPRRGLGWGGRKLEEEQMELIEQATVASFSSLSDKGLVADGHRYKQYHDETAGLTDQNQYMAAYRRWLAFEGDYEQALSRFKRECKDAQVDWRVFWKHAKTQERLHQQKLYRQRLQDLDGTSSAFPLANGSLSNNEGRDEVLLHETFRDEAVDPENYFSDGDVDDELMRFVRFLTTLRKNCDFAKEVMERIEYDIKEHTQKVDLRRAGHGCKNHSKEKQYRSRSSSALSKQTESQATNKTTQQSSRHAARVETRDRLDRESTFGTSIATREQEESPLLDNGVGCESTNDEISIFCESSEWGIAGLAEDEVFESARMTRSSSLTSANRFPTGPTTDDGDRLDHGRFLKPVRIPVRGLLSGIPNHLPWKKQGATETGVKENIDGVVFQL